MSRSRNETYEEYLARCKKYNQTEGARRARQKYAASPKGKAVHLKAAAKCISRNPHQYRAMWFLGKYPDCTSSRDEVQSIMESGLDWAGKPKSPGVKYHLDHIHGGPAVGYVPCQFNFALSEYVVGHWDEFVAYKARRDEMEA